LFQLLDNFRTQDTFVGPSGTLTPPLATGVVQRAVLITLPSCALIMVMRAASVRLSLTVFVPSGV